MGQMQTISRGHTRVRTEGGVTGVRYHATDVVTFNAETITLRTGGWRTVTTKTRMNQTANQYDLGYTVFQRDFEWFVHTDAGDFPFDGPDLTIDRANMKPTTEREIPLTWDVGRE